MLDLRFEPSTPFTDQDILDIETSLDRKLPKTYHDFVKLYGGAFIGGEVQGPKVTSILGFFDADEYRGPSSLLETYSDLRKIGALPIANCEFGNKYVLTRTNEVHYIDYTKGRTSAHKISDSFEDFLSRISIEQEA